MRPDQAIALLSVEDWPPRLEHWPPKHKEQWKPGMRLVGRIETVMALPRPEGSKKRGEPYTALYVRREPDHRLVMFHGWHTAADDLDGMHPAPGLLFAAYYRGEETSGFENFKFIVAPWDDPPPAAQPTRQAGGRPTEAPPSSAPEGGVGASASPSGSNQQLGEFDVLLPQITNTNEAREYVQLQTVAWQRDFQRKANDAKESGSLAHLPPLQMWLALIVDTWAAQGVTARPGRGEAA